MGKRCLFSMVGQVSAGEESAVLSSVQPYVLCALFPGRAYAFTSWPTHCQQWHPTPSCWNPPNSWSTSSNFTSRKPGYLHLTFEGILSAPWWPLNYGHLYPLCLPLLESRDHFLLNHCTHSRCVQIYAKVNQQEDKRRMENICCFENFTMERDLWNQGLLELRGLLIPPLNLCDLYYRAIFLGNHKKGRKISQPMKAKNGSSFDAEEILTDPLRTHLLDQSSSSVYNRRKVPLGLSFRPPNTQLFGK